MKLSQSKLQNFLKYISKKNLGRALEEIAENLIIVKKD